MFTALGAPLILLQTGLVSGLSLLSTATLMLASVATVVLGLFATLVHHNETIRWLIFAISIVVSPVASGHTRMVWRR